MGWRRNAVGPLGWAMTAMPWLGSAVWSGRGYGPVCRSAARCGSVSSCVGCIMAAVVVAVIPVAATALAGSV